MGADPVGEPRSRTLSIGKLILPPEILKLILSLIPVPATSGDVTSSPSAPPILLNVANKSGNTALHWAALNGHLEAAKALVEAGADMGVKNLAGHDAAFEAEQAGKEEVAAWLIGVRAERDDLTVREEEAEDEDTKTELLETT